MPNAIEALTAAQVEERLDELLGAVLSSRRTATEPAKTMSALTRPEQDFALHWAGVIAKSNSEMAYQFVDRVAQAFELMDSSGVEGWIIAAMDTYDRNGLYPGSAAFRDVENFAAGLSQGHCAATFENHVGVLEKYVKGVSGRALALKADEQAWTDTETLYLPETTCSFDSVQMNFQLLKSMTAYLWAQTRFGTFRIDRKTGVPIICAEIAKHADAQRALEIFGAVEEVRVMARMKRELPGLVRQMNEWTAPSRSNPEFELFDEIVAPLAHPQSDVQDSLAAVAEIIRRKANCPEASLFRGTVDLERVRVAARGRVEKEKQLFQSMLATMAENLGKPAAEDSDPAETAASIDVHAETGDLDDWSLELTIDGEPVEPPSELMEAASSIVQDFGAMPDEYLVAAGPGDYRSGDEAAESSGDAEESPRDGLHYDEWDYRRNHYRKNWCVLRETEMHPGDVRVVEEVLEKYAHLIAGIRKTFEVLRGDDRLQRRQKQGDDIDIEALVENYVDSRQGMEMSDRLFTKSRRVDRDLAVVFMVDVSGSTKGWINVAERESLVLLCEALETLDDRYAIYGFSGMTRKRCELYRVKRFDEPYGRRVKERIAGLRPQDYTRMGVTIRHLSKLLLEVEAKTKVLITLSDGKPDDYDGYRGEYGIEDTRQALLEAKHAGIHPFCITIDTQAHDYLPRMYGHVNYAMVNDVRKLPLSVSSIYRRLTA